MNKLTYLLLGAGAFLLGSCAQEDLTSPVSQGDGNVSVTINLPESFRTRTIGDGLTATYLNYGVYEYDSSSSTATYVLSGNTSFTNTSLQTTVTLNLINGKNYKIVFFAQSAESMTSSSPVYTFDAQSQTVTVNYDNMTSANNIADAYDCFYNTIETGTITNTTQNFSVTLNRPVCQINWGTNDLTSAAAEYGTNGEYIEATLTTNAYNTLNLITGEVSNLTSVSLDNFAPPTTATFPITGYNYVAMQYLLAPSTSSTVYDLNLKITNGGNSSVTTPLTTTIPVTNATVQANYRTNIYGTLLTTSATFTVTKDNNWNDNSYNNALTWDGTSTTTPAIDTEAKTVSLNQPSDLAGLADMLTSGNEYNNFKDYTINLYNDFDMGGNTFKGLGSSTRSSSNMSGTSFQGTIDGGGHTISNMVIEGTGTTGESIGFIANLDGKDASVTNLNFEGLTINAPQAEQAGVIGVISNGASVSNVKVLSGQISSKEGAGGVVGRVILNGNVSNCENHATVTTTGSNTGGVVGAAYYTNSSTLITISGCTNYGNISGQSQAIGGVVGLSAANVSNCTNNGTVMGTSTSTGGIIGQQMSAGTISGCVNNGKVVGGSGYGSGGIVGWVRYQISGYSYQEVITVENCTNNASVSGTTGVGGIVGTWYMAGKCNNNINKAPSISASSQFVAGIVGNAQWTEPTSVSGSISGDNSKLYVTNNYSTTTLDEMTGGLKSLYVYANSSEYVDQTGNSQTLPPSSN